MRRSNRLAAACGAVALAFIASSPAAAALLTNGNFNLDADANGTPDGWSRFAFGATGFTDYKPGTDALNYDGTPFINLGNYGAYGSANGFWSQDVAASAGLTYTGSIFSRTETYGAPVGELRLIFRDAANATLSTATATVGVNEGTYFTTWTPYSVTASAPAGTASIRFEVTNRFNSSGTILFDNASLVVPEPTTLAALGGLLAVGAMRRRR